MTQRKAHNYAKVEKSKAEDRLAELYESAKKSSQVPSKVSEV